MIICQSFSEIASLPSPIGLSIGTFDGVHLGHQALFHFLRRKASFQGSVAALTFTSHPSHFFNHSKRARLLCTLEHKLKLLDLLGVDLVILMEFNAQFAEQPFDRFLQEIKQHLPFSYLALGQGASFGKDREGNPENVKKLAPQLNFEVDYLPKTLLENRPVSSGRIRCALEQGDFREVATLLGRPYSILAPVMDRSDVLTLDTDNLCLPPDGTYPVRIGDTGVQGEATIATQTKIIRLACDPLPVSIGAQVEIVF